MHLITLFHVSIFLLLVLPTITTTTAAAAADISTTIQNHLRTETEQQINNNSPTLITQEIPAPDAYVQIFSMGYNNYIGTYNIGSTPFFSGYSYTLNPFHIHQISPSTGAIPALYTITVNGDAKTMCATSAVLVVYTNQVQTKIDQFAATLWPLSCKFTFEYNADTSTFKIAAVYFDTSGNVSELRYLRPILYDTWKLGTTKSPQTSSFYANNCDNIELCESFNIYLQSVTA
jgi:hypothetical protein